MIDFLALLLWEPFKNAPSYVKAMGFFGFALLAVPLAMVVARLLAKFLSEENEKHLVVSSNASDGSNSAALLNSPDAKVTTITGGQNYFGLDPFSHASHPINEASVINSNPTTPVLLELGRLRAEGVRLRNDVQRISRVGDLRKWVVEMKAWRN